MKIGIEYSDMIDLTFSEGVKKALEEYLKKSRFTTPFPPISTDQTVNKVSTQV